MALITGLLTLIGCTSVPSFTSHGILNLRVVDPSMAIYRGGQPNSKGFAYLKSIGVTNIVKLNLENNGDKDAKDLGMTVVYVPIPIDEQLIHVSKDQIDKAVGSITPGTYIHCEHGQDRTGLVVAAYRISTGTSKKDAEKEMLSNGFHKVLHGLWDYFEDHL